MVRNQKTAGKVARMTSKEAQNMKDDLGNKGDSQKFRETSPEEGRVESSQRSGLESAQTWPHVRKTLVMIPRKTLVMIPFQAVTFYVFPLCKNQFPDTAEWDLQAETCIPSGGRNLKANGSDSLASITIT